MVSIKNEVFTKLKSEITTAKVKSPSQNTENTFPVITFSEISNTINKFSIDTSGENNSNILFEVNIFTIGNNKESECMTLITKVDDILSGFYRMSRDFSNQIENYADTNVYRHILRYSCIVNKNKTIYRG